MPPADMLATVLQIPSSDRALATAQRTLERLYTASRDVRWLVALVALSTHSSGTPSDTALETALLRAQHLLAPASRSGGTEKARVVAAYTQLLNAALDAAASARQQAVVAAVLSRVALVLATRWRRSTPAALELLAAAAAGCAEYRGARSFAKWPLFARGALLLADGQRDAQALGCFQNAAVLAGDDGALTSGVERRDGAFHYWFGAALFRNARMGDAAEQLRLALRCGFEPAATLNLAALAHLRGDGDVHAAALALQRALEVDFGASATLYNYAVLLSELRNTVAQQQMLVYYQEAVALGQAAAVVGEKKRERSGAPKRRGSEATPSPVATASPSLSWVAEAQANEVFAPNPSRVTDAMVARQLAYAAMATEDYERAKEQFERVLALEGAAVQVDERRDYIYVLLQSNLHELALEQSERLLASMPDAAADAGPEWLPVLLYKADALLCLERVRECRAFLQQSVEPRVAQLLERRTMIGASSVDPDEVAASHTQLLNNLAVVTACTSADDPDGGGVDAAIGLLRGGLQLYPRALSLTFNLVLLLWRKQQRDAACAIWFEARAWSLRMDTTDVSDDRRAVEMVAAAEEAAVAAAASSRPQISEHVRGAEDGEGGVASQQLLYLDALVLNHWGKVQNFRAMQTSVRYVQYLDGLGEEQQLSKWWTALSRLVLVQLVASLLMQLSYVAFPAYNFALALWCLVCCTPKWVAKNPRLVPLHMLALVVSIVTDIIWMSLWVSGRVFYDQFCGLNSVSIVSCSGPAERFPGCQTNRFALLTLIVDDLAKAATAAALYRVHTLGSSGHGNGSGSNHRHHHHRTHGDPPAATAPSSIPNNQSAVHQAPPTVTSGSHYDPQSQA
ncbi:hypothetical protein PybrP1_002324 [[Pythium] brassicae (nom. inval.)]|nr:hypothetical protein PybrP1_002324 [[Pythium] brassicae (nom. inval.)]